MATTHMPMATGMEKSRTTAQAPTNRTRQAPIIQK
ncbi:hypothetical protein STANM309S_03636 [Streptomyces tanashiensis]